MDYCSNLLEEKVDSLLYFLESYVNMCKLNEQDVTILKLKIDKLLYECLYYRSKLSC
ncbi:MAG: hypothetical protein ACOYWZ_18730 [Bacillota bacterium]